MRATVTSKGQVTLPVEARRRMGIRAGTKLKFAIGDNGRMEVQKVEKGSVRALKGILPKPRRKLSLSDMDAAIARGAAS